MIDEKKLIEGFRKSHISFNGTPMEESDMMISYRSVVRVINKQPKVSEWIPCSERLPSNDEEEVLIFYREKSEDENNAFEGMAISRYRQVVIGGSFDLGYKDWVAPFDYFHKSYKVIAWMPLPAPYKEDMRKKVK